MRKMKMDVAIAAPKEPRHFADKEAKDKEEGGWRARGRWVAIAA